MSILVASVDALVCIKAAAAGVDPYGSSLITKAAGPDVDGNVPTKQPATAPHGTSLTINATDQYYDLVETALLDVENITAQRLSSIGTYSPDAILSEIEALQKKTQTAPTAADQQSAAQGAEAVVKATGTQTTSTTLAVVNDGQTTATVAAKPDAAANLLSTRGTIDLDTATLKALQIPGMTLDRDKEGNAVAVLPAADERKAQEDQTAVAQTLIYINQLQPTLAKCVIRAKL